MRNREWITRREGRGVSPRQAKSAVPYLVYIGPGWGGTDERGIPRYIHASHVPAAIFSPGVVPTRCASSPEASWMAGCTRAADMGGGGNQRHTVPSSSLDTASRVSWASHLQSGTGEQQLPSGGHDRVISNDSGRLRCRDRKVVDGTRSSLAQGWGSWKVLEGSNRCHLAGARHLGGLGP